jgi:hypothetical protein
MRLTGERTIAYPGRMSIRIASWLPRLPNRGERGHCRGRSAGREWRGWHRAAALPGELTRRPRKPKKLAPPQGRDHILAAEFKPAAPSGKIHIARILNNLAG